MTPAHLKVFRKHFALRRDQAALLVRCTKKDWAAWEEGRAKLPDNIPPRIKRAVSVLRRKIASHARYCQHCGKKVEKALQHGQKSCPYCRLRPVPGWPAQVARVLRGMRPEIPHDPEQLYKATLQDIKTKVKNIKRVVL